MRLPFVVLFLIAGPRLPAPDAHVAHLIAQLGSPQFAERENASAALDALGPAALDALRQAARSDDAEVRRRAEELIPRLQRRADTARLLAPERVHLVCRDLPVPAAVAEFARQTGFALRLDGDRTRLANRKVTLDTGETDFWEAYARFCQAADLVERRPEPVRPLEANLTGRGTRVIHLSNVAPAPDGRLIVHDGKPEDVPTCTAGALRLRVLPAAVALPGQRKAPGETLLALEVTPEPRLQWRNVLSLRIDRAVDDRGQTLTQPGAFIPNTLEPGPHEEVIYIVEGDGTLPGADQRHLPVRLKLAPQPSKRLAELRGTLTAQVQGPAERLVRADEILKAGGRTFQAGDGATLKVLAVNRSSAVEVDLQVEVTTPLRDSAVNRLGGRVVRVNRVTRSRLNQLPKESGEPILVLEDAHGEAFRLLTCEMSMQSDTALIVRVFHLTYLQERNRAEPARLVFNGRRTATVEVPFVLRDVPLP